ncbi:MAG: SOS response-associated peptidase family protein [Deltaproteobacteria bacterium]|nr:SOS response-associated peptidase family protein [Deltaproteobacteria bacterium]
MCYSAMVEQDAKKLARMFNAKVQTDFYSELFGRRLEGEKLTINKAMEIPFLKNASSMEEKAIASKIRKWHENEIKRLNEELEKQEIRLKKAEETLKEKETKKAFEDKRISTSKISKCKFDIARHETENLKSESESRIYPFNYISVLCLDDGGNKVIRPMRYHMRPHNENESFDETHGGCYNARFDSLTKVRFWNDSLLKRRGLMVLKKFYENVPIEKYPNRKNLPAEIQNQNNIVICFEPKGIENMFIPVIWDCWEKSGQPQLYSAALITDEPAPEIRATGHDRTPIFIKEIAVDNWLKAQGTAKEIKDIFLSDREKPYYDHEVMGAA